MEPTASGICRYGRGSNRWVDCGRFALDTGTAEPIPVNAIPDVAANVAQIDQHRPRMAATRCCV